VGANALRQGGLRRQDPSLLRFLLPPAGTATHCIRTPLSRPLNQDVDGEPLLFPHRLSTPKSPRPISVSLTTVKTDGFPCNARMRRAPWRPASRHRAESGHHDCPCSFAPIARFIAAPFLSGRRRATIISRSQLHCPGSGAGSAARWPQGTRTPGTCQQEPQGHGPGTQRKFAAGHGGPGCRLSGQAPEPGTAGHGGARS
jgi:hypothetical protein